MRAARRRHTAAALVRILTLSLDLNASAFGATVLIASIFVNFLFSLKHSELPAVTLTSFSLKKNSLFFYLHVKYSEHWHKQSFTEERKYFNPTPDESSVCLQGVVTVFVYLVTVAGVCVYAAPCQNVLDYFKTVLEFHNQLVQPMPEEQLTEVRKEGSCALMHSYFKHVSSLAHVNKIFGVLIVRSCGVKMWDFKENSVSAGRRAADCVRGLCFYSTYDSFC